MKIIRFFNDIFSSIKSEIFFWIFRKIVKDELVICYLSLILESIFTPELGKEKSLDFSKKVIHELSKE